MRMLKERAASKLQHRKEKTITIIKKLLLKFYLINYMFNIMCKHFALIKYKQ